MRTENLKAIGAMLAAVGFFACMDATLKQLSGYYAPQQVTFLRGAASLPFVLIPLALQGAWSELRTTRPALHLFRGFLGITMLVTFIYAVSRLSLADVYSVYLAAPLLATALGVPLLGDRVPPRRWLAILAGLVGVWVILRPSGAGYATVAGLVAALSALCYALNVVTIRVLGRTDSSRGMVVWFLALVTLGAGALAIPGWRAVPLEHVPWIALLGLTGALGQQLITDAFRRAAPSVVAPFEYSALLWAIAIDWTFWSVLPDARVYVGGAIVVASGLYILRDEHRAAR
jgi:drug/metabolite transporter (DMT)-like permease